MPQLCGNGQRIAETALRKARAGVFSAETEAESVEAGHRIDRLKHLLKDTWNERAHDVETRRTLHYME